MTQQVFNNAVDFLGEREASKDPSRIINRASDMLSVADAKVTRPTAFGHSGLASPFNFD